MVSCSPEPAGVPTERGSQTLWRAPPRVPPNLPSPPAQSPSAALLIQLRRFTLPQ